MKEFLKSKYQLTNPQIKKLDGYINLNYKIESISGTLILKEFPNNKTNFDFISAENELLLYLAKNKTGLFPSPIKNTEGNYISIFSDLKNFWWLISWLDGDFLAETEHNAELFKSFGAFLAKMDSIL